MNNKNLEAIINQYENNYTLINNAQHNEIFKWKALKQFNSVWYSEEAKSMPFSKMFAEAKKDCLIFIDNNQISPTNGIVKMAEVEPEEIERLFKEVLTADDGGDIKKRQENLELFIEGIEVVRQKHFPKFWKYKQDRHAASCYLTFIKPEDNYIYRYSEAETFAQYVEFGLDIGSGNNFSLENYYKLGDEIVSALREHPSLIEKHFKLIDSNSEYYKDESLRLLAFDLMYCARCYGFYDGLEHESKKEYLKAYKLDQLREKELQDKQEKIDKISREIHELELSLDGYSDISLLNVEVYQPLYGKGIVIEHNINKISVKFADTEKTYVIHKKYFMRPTFENDMEIVEDLSYYADTKEKIDNLKKEQERLLKNIQKYKLS